MQAPCVANGRVRHSVMRWQLVAQAAKARTAAPIVLLTAQSAHLFDQQVDVLLLAGDQGVEVVEQVFHEPDLDLKVDEALFGVDR